jgi:AraC-like DNA-binding protein
MEPTQSLEEFYRHKFNWMPDNLKNGMGHFNVFRTDDFISKHARTTPFSRKDFFKITLLIGKYRLGYADKIVEVEKQALVFSNPLIPYAYEALSEEPGGFFCIFTDSFFNQFGNIKEYPVFQPGTTPVFILTDEQVPVIKNVFAKMLEEIGSDYTYKYDVLRNLAFELIHFAMKLQPAAACLYSGSNASTRISSLFMELLERQFPIESAQQQIVLQSPSAFASQLSVHVNHLNRALRETTGKTTSRIIAERVTQEARSLLLHTNWNVSEIAWTLGFEEPSHFINFFKKNADVSPGVFRSAATHPSDIV